MFLTQQTSHDQEGKKKNRNKNGALHKKIKIKIKIIKRTREKERQVRENDDHQKPASKPIGKSYLYLNFEPIEKIFLEGGLG